MLPYIYSIHGFYGIFSVGQHRRLQPQLLPPILSASGSARPHAYRCRWEGGLVDRLPLIGPGVDSLSWVQPILILTDLHYRIILKWDDGHFNNKSSEHRKILEKLMFYLLWDQNIHIWNTGWWFQPPWKIWVRQLGLLFPIYGKS